MSASIAELIARFVVGSVMLWAGLTKMTSPRDAVRNTVRSYGLPGAFSNLVASILPGTETALGLAVIAGAFMPWSSLLASMLLVVFATWMAINIANGKVFPCGCFGSREGDVISWGHVIMNVSLAAAGVVTSGVFWGHHWRWPLALAPVEAHLSRWDVASAVFDAAGVLIIGALVRAFGSLTRYAMSSRGEIVEMS